MSVSLLLFIGISSCITLGFVLDPIAATSIKYLLYGVYFVIRVGSVTVHSVLSNLSSYNNKVELSLEGTTLFDPIQQLDENI